MNLIMRLRFEEKERKQRLEEILGTNTVTSFFVSFVCILFI